MKFSLIISFLLIVLVIGCTENKIPDKLSITHSAEPSIEIPNKSVDKSLLDYDNQTSTWSLNGKAFSGFLVSYYLDSTLKEKSGILNGKKQNKSSKWYPDGRLKQTAHYKEGKLHGEKKLWLLDTNYVLVAHLNYQSGRAHGKQKQWYPTGELYKVLNLNMGREEGIQKAFRKNGELYANYEAKEGRIFGLKKAALCYGLENENFKDEN